MNGWLVVARCTMDDLLLGLFATEEEARKFARLWDEDQVLKVARKFELEISPGSLICLSILEFVKGEPQRYIIVKEFQ